MSVGLSLAPVVSALAGATVHPHEAGLIDLLRGRDGTVLDFVRGHALQRSEGGGWLRTIGEATDFARASAAGRWRADGVYEMVGSGVLRYEHEPVTRAPLGVLVESARTNSFVNAVWNGPATPTSWAAQNPEGISVIPSKFGAAIGARRFTATGNRPNIRQVVTLTAGVTYTASVMVEAISSSTAAFFTMFANVANTTVTFPSCAANPAGGMNGALQPGLLVMQIVSTVTQSATVVVGAGVVNVQTGLAIDLSMPQIEAGIGSTSYIVTGATAVTRATDNLSMSLPVVPANGFTITFRAHMPRYGNAGDSNILFSILPASGTGNRLDIDTYSGVGTLWFNRPSAGTYRQIAGGVGLGAEFRGAVSWSASRGYRATVNGGAVVTATDGAPSETLSRITIGSRAGAAVWGSTIKLAALWPHGDFSDAELLGFLS